MPVKIKQEDGTEVEVFTKEDVDAAVAEKLTELNTKLADIEGKIPKEVTVEKKEDDNPSKKDDEQIPEWAKSIQTRLDALSGTVTSETKQKYIGSVAAALDADKRAEVSTKFDSLTGYPDTPDGQAQRAKDAYMLITGERFDDNGVNMQNIAGASMGHNDTKPKALDTEADKQVQAALGITPEDVEKFAKK